MQQKLFKSTGRFVIGVSLLIITAGVFSCNDDKKTDTTATDTTSTSTSTMTTSKDTSKMMAKDTMSVSDTGRKTDQTPPPKH